MEVQITEKREEPLLHRTKYVCSTTSKATPTRADVKKALMAKLGADNEKLIIEKIAQQFGGQNYVVEAKLYDSKENLLEIEQKHKIKRDNPSLLPAPKPKAEEKKEEKK